MEEAAAGVVVIFVLVLILLLVGEPTYHSTTHSISDRPHSFLRKRDWESHSQAVSKKLPDICYAGLLLRYCSFCIEPEDSLDSEVITS